MIDTSSPVANDVGAAVGRDAPPTVRDAAVLRLVDPAPRVFERRRSPRSITDIEKPVKVRGFMDALNVALGCIQTYG